MKHLDFRLITITDFREFRGTHKLDLRKLGAGVHFVAGVNMVEPRLGSNGAGKSSIWDAWHWCLTGKTVDGLRGVDVRTWLTKNHARVEIALTINEFAATIARSTEPNGLWFNGKVCDQATIDQEVGLNVSNLAHTLIIGQGQPLFFDLPPQEKMTLLSETLDLDRWQERSKRAALAVQSIASEMSALEGQLSELERTIKSNADNIALLSDKSETWISERAGRDETRAKALAGLRGVLAAATKLKGDHDLALDSAETEARATRKQKTKAESALAEAASMVAAGSATIGIKLDELSRLDKDALEAGDKCPTCGQSLKGTSLATHNAEVGRRIRALEKELETERGMHQTFIDARDKAKRDLDKLARELEGFESKADDARDGYTRASQTVSDAEAQIKALEAQQDVDENEANPYTELLRAARKSRTKLNNDKETDERALAGLSRKKERTAYWVQGFKNVRLYLLREVLDELQGVTQTLLPSIGLEDWLVEFEIEKELQSGKTKPGLIVSISNPRSNKSVRWEAWSGGQGQRLRLIGAIALSEVLLRRAGVSCDLMIFDEPTRHLSPEGVRETIDFLIDRGRDAQIFYVDHQAVESSQFASTITVSLDDAGSHIAINRG